MAEWMDLTGKVIIVTGGSRGIGEHVVKILRRNNATVIVADLTPNPDYESDENILFINCNESLYGPNSTKRFLASKYLPSFIYFVACSYLLL